MFDICSNNDNLINSLEFLLKLIGAIYTLTLFTFGIIRYNKEQIWKRNEFVAEQAKVFYTDKMVCNTMYMLDYLPHSIARNIELFPNHPNYEDRYVEVDVAVFKSALKHHNDISKQFSQVEIAIRDNFDNFLNYFEIFDQYIEAGLIKQKELRPYLEYWIAKINDDENPSAIKVAVLQYINDYKFKGIQKFIERFKKDNELKAKNYFKNYLINVIRYLFSKK